MSKPILLIGIGTSGLRVLEHVQHFYYENTGENRPPNVEYLYLETDESTIPDVTAVKNELKRVNIKVTERETMIKSLRANDQIDSYWIPPSEYILDAGFGAGGLPAFGRAILWGHQNWEQVSDAIRNAHSKIGNYTIKDSDDSKPAVFITGTLAGGTGAGMFIDLAYMVRHLIDDISEIYGLFLIPGRQSFRGHEIIYCNTYAALKALDYYTDKNNKYHVRWPDGHFAKFEDPPFELAQIISQDYTGDIPSIGTLSGLYRMAGLYLFLNIFGLRGKRLTRLGDAKASQYIDKYGTFGLSAIQYPKSQLEEYIALGLTIDLFKRWINQKFYYRMGTQQELSFEKAKIYNDTLERFEWMLRKAFEVFDTITIAEGRKIINDLEHEAALINKKDFMEKSEYEHIQSLFSSRKAGNYYDAANNHLNLASDILISHIYELIAQSLDEYESLAIAKIQLEAIVSAIDNCLKFWKENNLSSEMNRWENLLEEQIKWILKTRYKLLLEQNRVVFDRLKSTFDLMKMHLFIKKLIDIRNNISGGEESIFTRNLDKNVELPRIKRIEEIISLISKTIGFEEREKGDIKLKTLIARKNEIYNEIMDTTIPILRIFPSGSFDKEIDNSLTSYKQDSNTSIPSKKIYLGENSLWEYLMQSKESLPKKLYNDFISSFEQDIRRHESVRDYKVSEYIKRKPEESKKIAMRATYPLVKINSDRKTAFQDAAKIPKLIIGPDKPTIDNIVEVFKDLQFFEFTNDEDGVFIKEELKNIIVFYTEKGYMNDKSNFRPLKHLRYINEIETLYYEHPRQKGINEKEWHILRNPYIKWEEK